ncbi:MAG TPA: hypothetical protein VHV55_23945 [Pirellulales bacterium]|nr:hypothetical protein [Pirellulales bacterium]
MCKPKLESGCWRLAADVWHLVRRWWASDRIRLSPDEGRLLRLEPGSILVIEGRPVEVLERRAGEAAAGPYVEYRCRGSGVQGRLRVAPLGPDHCLRADWLEAGHSHGLPPVAIEVYMAPSRFV